MKKVFISRLDKKAELNHYLDVQANLCEYWARCGKACRRDKDCAIKRFYDKYPDYEFLGIGAATEPPRRRYEAN